MFADINTKIADQEGSRQGELIGVVISDAVLENMSRHFLLHKTPLAWGGWMWIILRQGSVVQSHTEFILSTYHRMLRNVSVQDPRHNTDYYMVLGCLHRDVQRTI